MMQQVLADLPKTTCMDYIDDVLVVGRTLDEHLENLEMVLKRLKDAGLKIKPEKCSLMRPEVKYLGFVVSREGVKTDPEKVDAVQRFPRPENVRRLRSFLGLTSYYRRFVPGYAKIARPLHELTSAQAEFLWTNDCEAAFQKLKKSLTAAPVLEFPNFGKPYVLETDASAQGLGAVLAQKKEDGKIHPIAYASRTTQGAEKNYASSELEALAVVWATRHFRHYLYGTKCTVLTDNIALKSLLATPHPSGRLARWGLALQELDLDIQHRSGKANKNADALSRNPAPSQERETNSGERVARDASSLSQEQHDERVISVNTIDVVDNNFTCETFKSIGELRGAQMEDPELKAYFGYLEEKILPAEEVRARRIVAESYFLEIQDGVLYRAEKDGRLKLIPPEMMRKQILEDLHSGKCGAPLGFLKTLGRLTAHYWWPGWCRDLKQWCEQCQVCQSRRGGVIPRAPLTSIPVEGPWKLVGVDVLQMPKTRSGKTYIVVFMDHFTKWPEAFATTNQEAVTIAKLLVERIVPTHGVPERLLSDRGANFTSRLMEEAYKLLGIKKVYTTTYHPQTDGTVERFNRTLVDMLAKTASDDPKGWDTKLPYVLFSYRTAPHHSTGVTPYKLMFGRDALLPTTELLHPPEDYDYAGSYLEDMTERFQAAWKIAGQNIQKAQAKQKRYYDVRARPHKYQVGDKVLLYMPALKTGKMRKMALPNRGPYVITELTDIGVTVKPVEQRRAQAIRVAYERLRPYREGTSQTKTTECESQEEEASNEQEEEDQPWARRLRPRIRKLSVTGTSNQGEGRCNEYEMLWLRETLIDSITLSGTHQLELVDKEDTPTPSPNHWPHTLSNCTETSQPTRAAASV